MTCASAGASTSAEASRATKNAMLLERDDGTADNASRRPRVSDGRSGLPAQEVRDQTQARRLALLGMELRPGEVVASDDGGDGAAIVGQRQHGLRAARLELEGVHEIGVIARRDAVQQGVWLQRIEL